MKVAKTFESFLDIDWKDPFGFKKRKDEEILKNKERILISSQPPSIKKMMECIKRSKCIVDARLIDADVDGPFGKELTSDKIYKSVLLNGMKIKLSKNFVSIDGGDPIELTRDQFKELFTKIDNFIRSPRWAKI